MPSSCGTFAPTVGTDCLSYLFARRQPAACASSSEQNQRYRTGYSSLSQLQSFAFDWSKIDRSFVVDLEINPQSQVIVRAFCTLAHGLGVPVTAEGVETAEQLRMLTMENCDTVQGYYLGRPQPLEDFAAMASKDLPHAA